MNVADVMVIMALLILVSISFALSAPIIYYAGNYASEIALLRAINSLNDAIQFVYGRPQISVSLDIYLPQGVWIKIEGNKITLSSNLTMELMNQITDPNRIIIERSPNSITYNVTFLGGIVLADTVNKIYVKCVTLTTISIGRTL